MLATNRHLSSPPSILELASSGKAELMQRDMRVRSLWSNYYFAKTVLGYRELVPHLHFHDMELFISRWADGARRQLIEYPRGFFKSTCYTVGTSMWVVCPVTDEDTEYAVETLGIPEDAWEHRMKLHNQDALQLFAFETADNSKKKVAEVRWHFEENTLFRTLFPEIKYTGTEPTWNDSCLRIRRSAKGYAQRSAEGSFEAIGAGNALQSRHYDVVWEDDLIGERSSKSETELAKICGWHSRLNGAFVDASKQVRFIIGNRWGYADLNSHIREKEPGDWQIYSRSAYELQAASDPDDPDAAGKEVPIFPERFPMAKLEEIRRSMTDYDFSCQYLNEPTLPGKQEVEFSGLHTYTITDYGHITCSCGAILNPASFFRVMSYDPYAAKGIASKSLPAISVVGCSPDKHKILLDYYIEKESYKKIFTALFKMNTRWRPHVFSYEDVGAQNMAEFYIKQYQESAEFREKKYLRFPTIKPLTSGGRGGELRIRDFLLPALQEKFTYRAGGKHFHFEQSLKTFPNPVLGHDYDLLDCLAQAPRVWRFPESSEEELNRENEEEFVKSQLGQPYSHTTVSV